MFPMTFNEIAQAVGGRLLQGNGELVVSMISTDSRKIAQDELFIPLVGERFDGHGFIEKALAEGAMGLMVSRDWSPAPTELPVIKVDDTLKALQLLAAHNRAKFAGRVVAVTGSNGKTTTKDMITSVLSNKFQTIKTEGNLNNEIGLPLTLLRIGPEHQAAVVEMGMRGLGQISQLAVLAKPDLGVITNISEVHLELLGSIDKIAQAKGELLEHLDRRGTAILNGDELLIRREADQYGGEKVFYGFGEANDLRAEQVQVNEKGSTYTAVYAGQAVPIKLPVLGSHNVLNSLAAVAVGLKLGLTWLEIADGLANLQLTGMRLEVMETGRWQIINDAYNANPAATRAALQVLAQVAGGRNSRKIAVLGNMFELGSRASEGHREMGRAAVENGVEYLITIGSLAEEIAAGAREAGMAPNRIRICLSNQAALQELEKLLQKGDTILVKGSRGMKMEEIVAGLVG